MYASLADRSTRKLLTYLSRIDLLVIDEMGYLNLRPEQTNIFFKLMEERYRRHATIITTNLDYEEWHNFLGSKPLVEALCRVYAINATPSASTAPPCAIRRAPDGAAVPGATACADLAVAPARTRTALTRPDPN